MKKVRRILTFVLCVCMLMSMSVTAFAAEPRVIVAKCVQCGEGNVTTHTSRKYGGDIQSDCTHGYSSGKDWYEVYDVTQHSSCDNCSYSDVIKYKDYVLKSCNGH